MKKLYQPISIVVVDAYQDCILASYGQEGAGDFADFSLWD